MPIPNSPPRKVAWLPALTAVLFAGTLALGDDRSVRVNGRITDAATGQAVAARLYIRGDDGKHFFARSSDPRGSAVVYDRQRGRSFERHTTLSAHAFEADLPPGSYTLIAERGKEYLPKSVDLRITDRPARVDIPLRRWIDMAARGWYSGDTHVHRSLADLPNIVAAEDLNVTFPLVYWVTKAFEAPRRPSATAGAKLNPEPGRELIRVDDTHVIWPRNTEYEIFSVGGKRHTLGAVFLLNHRETFSEGAPPVAPIAAKTRREGGLIELDKHNWPWSMAIVPIMNVDLFELSNNHVWRTEFLFKNWGEEPADYMRVDRSTERGWIEFGFANYYALLDCGFRLRPTAGTASGVHPVPLGFGRVYVELPDGFDYDAWVRGLDAGRSFVTTEPMLFVRVDDQPPGHRFRFDGAAFGAGRSFRVAGEVVGPRPLSSLEIVVNGEVVRTIDAQATRTDAGALTTRFAETVQIDGSAWIAVRAFATLPDGRVRFAHSSPVHIDVAGKPLRPRREEVQYLVERVRRQIERSRGVLPPAAIAEYETALKAYRALESSAR